MIHVVVAVITNAHDEVLIALRKAHQHLGGLWEFPGGKVEPNESPKQALHRELYEELGLKIQSATPFIKIDHAYSDQSVHLDVWRVSAFDGAAVGQEGQTIRWVVRQDLCQYDFPEANYSIIKALLKKDEEHVKGI